MTRATAVVLGTLTLGVVLAGCDSGSRTKRGSTTPPIATDDHGNDSANATALGALPAFAPGTLEAAGDVDWFSVALVASQNYEFKTSQLANGADTILRLIDTNGTTQLAENDDVTVGDPSSLITHQPAASGTYFLEVRDKNGTAGATYVVEVRDLANPNAASLTGAMLTDVDGTNDATQGDTITLTFSEAVDIGAAVDPAVEFTLPVTGDSFGSGASIAAGGSSALVVTLGQDPVLRLTGTFDPANVQAMDPSGITLVPTTAITTVSSGQAATGTLDIDTTLTPGFVAAGTMGSARGLHTATLLDDGRVLVVGGVNPNYITQSEIWDSGTWTFADDPALGGNPGGFMVSNGIAVARMLHTATKLPSGQVLIVGGNGVERLDAAGNPVFEELTTVHTFDPATNSFSQGPNLLNQARSDHYANLLPNGMVVIAGGYNDQVNGGTSLTSAELYDPAQQTFANLPNLVVPRQWGTADMLGANVAYVAGLAWDVDPNNPPNVVAFMGLMSEVYDVAANTFTLGSNLQEDRRMHGSARHPSGDLLVLGGGDGAGPPTALTSVERMDQLTGGFTTVGNLQVGRAFPKTASLGRNFLVVGGVEFSTGAPVEISAGEIYDVDANVTEQHQAQNARNSHSVTTLQSGRVLVVGGFNGGTTTIFSMNGTPLAACEEFVIP